MGVINKGVKDKVDFMLNGEVVGSIEDLDWEDKSGAVYGAILADNGIREFIGEADQSS